MKTGGLPTNPAGDALPQWTPNKAYLGTAGTGVSRSIATREWSQAWSGKKAESRQAWAKPGLSPHHLLSAIDFYNALSYREAVTGIDRNRARASVVGELAESYRHVVLDSIQKG